MPNQAEPVVTIRNASLSFGGRTLWRRLSLTVMPGEFLAILGPNGSGKSSLLKTLLGLHRVSGTVNVLGRPTRPTNNGIGYIPQQKAFAPELSLTGRELVTLGLNGTRWFAPFTTNNDAKRTQTAISAVGATRYADQPLGVLSGGEQQRLRIAQAIVTEPQLLLCDEPLLSLDLASQHTTAELINSCRQKGAAVLFVTHEINPVLPFVDRVLYLVGSKWAVGTPQEVLTSSRLSELYGTPVDVLHVHGRIIVVAAGETPPTELHDTHHHEAGDTV